MAVARCELDAAVGRVRGRRAARTARSKRLVAARVASALTMLLLGINLTYGVNILVDHDALDTQANLRSGAAGGVVDDWGAVQVRAAANWAGPVWCFFFGGINYQIEHHLFPTVTHVHYPAIAPIVRETAAEFGLRYIAFDSVTDGLANVLQGFRMAKASHEPILRKSKGWPISVGLHGFLYMEIGVAGALLVSTATARRRRQLRDITISDKHV